jgi:preprotein translocase subunit YajC
MLPIVTFFQQAAPGAAGPAGAPAGGGLLEMLLLPLGMIVIFYFLLIRPQNQRMKKHKAMLEALKKGDTVLTQGGIIGKIFTLDTGEGGKLRIARGMVIDLYGVGEPAPANDAAKES